MEKCRHCSPPWPRICSYPAKKKKERGFRDPSKKKKRQLKRRPSLPQFTKDQAEARKKKMSTVEASTDKAAVKPAKPLGMRKNGTHSFTTALAFFLFFC